MNFFYFIYFIIIILHIKSEELNSISEITLTIKGACNQLILSDSNTYEASAFTELPDEVIINGIVQNDLNTKEYFLPNGISNITMKWINTQVTKC